MRGLLVAVSGAVLMAGVVMAAALPQAAGTSVQGQVVDAMSGRPIGEAEVWLEAVPDAASEMPLDAFDGLSHGDPVDDGPRASTDASGRFTVRDMAAGTFTVRAVKPPWQTGFHSRQSRSGLDEWIVVSGANQVSTVRVELPRLGAISGRVFGEHDQPLPEVVVGAYEPLTIEGARRYRRAGEVRTDDRGQFYLSLPSGEYVVGALIAGFPDAGDPELPSLDGRERTYRTTYFPNAAGISAAAPIALQPAEERPNVDVRLEHSTAYRVVGDIRGLRGLSLRHARLVPVGRDTPIDDLSFPSFLPVDETDTRKAGVLLTPGEYVVTARETPLAGWAPQENPRIVVLPVSPASVASVRFTVTSRDLTIPLQLAQAARLSGQVRFDGAPAPPGRTLAEHPLWVRGVTGTERARAVVFGSDDTFRSDWLTPGRYLVWGVPPPGWHLRSVMAGTRDVSDDPLEVGIEDVNNLVVTFTRHAATLAGRIVSTPPIERRMLVIVLPIERERWRSIAPSRRIRRVLTGRSRTFEIGGLPAGTYHVAAIEPAAWRQMSTPEGFASLAAAGTTVSLTEGDTRTIDLRVVRMP